MSKNVAVFVDVANIFYAAKAAGVDIDYVLLLKGATAGRDLVRAYAYTGLDPENENQRNFHSFLARHGFRVVSKDIRKYGDGRVKANLDIELVVDMMKTARNLDVAVVVSGDGDFAPAIRAVQEMGVRVEVISFRGNTSADLMEVADKFTDITRLAQAEKAEKAEKAPEPAAAPEEDLSMTEVPEKESAGPVRGRGRGRLAARGRERVERTEKVEKAEAVPVAAAGRRRSRAAGIVVLPGEKLSKAQQLAEASEPVEAEGAAVVPVTVELVEEGEPVEGALAAAAAPDEQAVAAAEEHRRRRRRGGGRGRGRGRGGDELAGLPQPGAGELPEEEEEEEPAPRAPRPGAFGSVWDSQIGIPSAPPAVGRRDEEEFDEEEPEIPEYLLAERRSGQARDRARGRGAYAAAIERERYGRGGAPRYGEKPRVGQPIRAGQPTRGGDRFPRRDARGGAPASRPERAEGRSSEPWSEVPPELEEILRAQLAQKLAARAEAEAPAAQPAAEPAPKAGRRGRRPAASAVEALPAPETAPEVAGAAPRRRTRKIAATAAPAALAVEAAAAGTAAVTAEAASRRPTRRPALAPA